MDVRRTGGLGCRFSCAEGRLGDSHTVPLEYCILLRFIHVLGERSRLDVDSVLLQLFSDFSGGEAALLHIAKCRIKSADGFAKRHFVFAFERLFLVLKVGKLRYDLADDFSIGRHNVFIPSDVFLTSG